MKITVVLFGGLETAMGKKPIELQLPERANVRDALVNLGEVEVEYASVVLNAQRASEDRELKNGDVLYIFRAIAGG